MIISHTNRFVFLKTPKTAGTSVQNALKPVCSFPDVVTYGNINQIVGEDVSPLTEFMTMRELSNIDKYFSFGFTRNPWSLVLSRYLYQVKRGRLPEFYVLNRMYFNCWLQTHYIMKDEHITDKTKTWLFEKGKQTVQFIGKFETLQEDFQYICYTIGHKNLKLEHYNKAQINVGDYRDWYDGTSRVLIYKRFGFEIDTFKYKF
jgi:hypothetical protein